MIFGVLVVTAITWYSRPKDEGNGKDEREAEYKPSHHADGGEAELFGGEIAAKALQSAQSSGSSIMAFGLVVEIQRSSS
jgi:hypothetical protein